MFTLLWSLLTLQKLKALIVLVPWFSKVVLKLYAPLFIICSVYLCPLANCLQNGAPISSLQFLVKNYRPISLLCTIPKVLERLVFIRVADHAADYISNCQFDFTKGRSSQQQLLIMLDTIYTNLTTKYILT